jgi:polysaccharide export outer membrane protein
MMKQTSAISTVLVTLIVFGGVSAIAQTTSGKKKNFGYSQNPKTKRASDQQPTTGPKAEPTPEAPKTDAVPQPEKRTETEQIARNETTIAERTLNVAKTAAKRTTPTTEQYLIGAGDVLLISLLNNSKASSYFTVLSDGTIDYGLAGDMVQVAGLTPEEVEELLIAKIKLYENPQVSVRVREFNSHRVKVLGLVENGGDRSIQREAVPLFVIRADAVVQPKADRVSVKRRDGSVEKFELKDAKWENVLVFPGDIVEFSSSVAIQDPSNQFVYMSGTMASGGMIAFHPGLTLTQAIVVAGGLKKPGARRVVIRRKNQAGLLESTEFNLKSINDGKSPDPNLAAGDVIEIPN